MKFTLIFIAAVAFAKDPKTTKKGLKKRGPETQTTLTEDDFKNAIMTDEGPSPEKDPLTDASSKYFEGDIFLPQYSPGQQVQYNGIRFGKWPYRKIPYAISSWYYPQSRYKIAGAMKEIEEKTCIKFEPRNGHRDYVFISPGSGCYSMIGRIGGQQKLSLDGHCLYHGVIVHELMHAIGFFHEQSRMDRNDWIEVHLHNVWPGQAYNFYRQGSSRITHLDTEYDYDSIMHYGAYAFSRNNQRTITQKKSGPSIGQRRGLSFNDVTKINRLYECEPTPSQECKDVRSDCKEAKSLCKGSEFVREMCKLTCGNCRSATTIAPARATTSIATKAKNTTPKTTENSKQCKDTRATCPDAKTFCYYEYVQKVCPFTCHRCL